MRMTDSGDEAAAGRPGRPAQRQGKSVRRLQFPLSRSASGHHPSRRQRSPAGRSRVSSPTVLGSDTWWQQGLPDEGGRTTVVHSSGGEPTELLPAPWNARTRVHEYGGRSYLPIPRGNLAGQPGEDGDAAHGSHQILFANYADQRLYLTGPGAEEPDPAYPRSGRGAGWRGRGHAARWRPRYADFVLSPDGREVWCVQERHFGGKVSRAIVAVPLDGSAADKAGAIRTLVDGSDFFAYPAPSPDGKWLAWICWNHPHMPWDGTELRVAPVENGVPGKGRPLMGGQRESVLAPLWRDNSSLYVATDWPGWWNIYQVGLTGEPPRALFPADEEFAGPLWQLGARPFALLGDGRLAVAHGAGLGPARRYWTRSRSSSRTWTPRSPNSTFDLSADGDVNRRHRRRAGDWPAVVRVDAATGRTEVLLRESAGLPDAGLPAGAAGSGFRGPVRPGRACACSTRRPTRMSPGRPGSGRPFVVWVHGGPTAPRLRRPRPGQGILHQPRHRDHRRELRRLHRLRPPVPGAAAPRVGNRRRPGRHRRRAVGGGLGRRRPGQAGHPRRLGGRLDHAGSGDHRHEARPRVQRCRFLLRRLRPEGLRRDYA